MGKRVLVSGSGPIGALTAIAARRAGAAEIVVTDIADGALRFRDPRRRRSRDQRRSGSPTRSPPTQRTRAISTPVRGLGRRGRAAFGIEVVRPRGTLVQLGLGGDMTIPINLITAKELELRGTFRFHEEFALALEFLGKGLVDVKPLITATAPLAERARRVRIGQRSLASMKVQIAF